MRNKQRAGIAAAVQRTGPTSVDSEEVARFDALAESWWDPAGPMAALHRLNPLRIDYIRSRTVQHFARPARALRPFEGLELIDVGCGGGLLAEPLARLGARVTGIDVSNENIEIARRHLPPGLCIDYRPTSAEALAGEGASYDIVVAMEVVEHVGDLNGFLCATSRLLKPGGAAFFATLNRTAKSYLMAIVGAEYLLGWLPRGTHRWERFVKPAELRRYLAENEIELVEVVGVSFDALRRRWRQSSDRGVNYMAYAKRA